MRTISVAIFFLASAMAVCADDSVIRCNHFLAKDTRYSKSGAGINHDNFPHCVIANVLQFADLNLDKACQNLEASNIASAKCSTLVSLHIENSTVLKISNGFLSKFPELKMFNANGLGLMQIRRDDFEAAANMEEIQLSNNLIAALEDGIISHMKMLKSFDASNNKITTLSEQTFIGASENLIQLNLKGNKISALDYTVFIPVAQRKSFPLELNLDENEIDEVKASHRVNHLQFQMLSLRRNRISAFSCPDMRIEELHLDANRVQSISLDNCSVEYLTAPKNSLKFLHLHSEVKGFIGSDNRIKSIVVGENPQMYHFEVGANEDISQALPTIATMSALKFLNLSHSHVGALKEDTFSSMRNLKYLHMESCGLKVIPFEIFVKNENLLDLDVSHNKLESIDLHMFAGLTNLNFLNIAANKITQIGNVENIRDVLPKLQSIDIEGNPWKCIELSRIVRALKQLNVQLVDAKNKNFGVQNILGIPCY